MTGFADRFSASQRAALVALGYAVLERRSPAVAHGAVLGPPLPDAPASDGMGHSTAPQRPAKARPMRDTPGSVVIDGMDGSPLARGVLAAASAGAGEGDARIRQAGGRLEIALGGGGDAWALTLDQLRRSPKHKAALWRALRLLARSPA